ncbi:MAG: hypothetical protein ACSHX6_01335 [Akkermansiaceae bacterium]
MKDLVNSVKNQISSRCSSPLFGAFVLSWLTFNHKYLFILFSEGEVDSRLELAGKTSFPNWNSALINGICYPLGSALIFLLLYPLLAIAVFAYWEKTQVWLKTIKLKIAKEMPHSPVEYNKLSAEYEALERKQNKEIAELREEKVTLVTQHGELLAKHEEVKGELWEKDAKLNKDEENLVELAKEVREIRLERDKLIEEKKVLLDDLDETLNNNVKISKKLDSILKEKEKYANFKENYKKSNKDNSVKYYPDEMEKAETEKAWKDEREDRKNTLQILPNKNEPK